MPASLEDRRLAVVAALLAVSTEPLPEPDAVEDDDTFDSRLDDLSARLDEVVARLDSVESALLEATWDTPAAAPFVQPDDDACDPNVSVPAVDLGEGRMSSVAAKALFGH